MGRGATAVLDRLAASLGFLNEATPRFAAALDVAKGGVLLALPALLVSGLLRHSSKYFQLPKGFYGLTTIFLLLAFMALARLKSVEQLRYYAPGEWGKLLGLDRAPEVRTLRIKLKHLADLDQAVPWSAELCKEWMTEAADEATVLYVDGHVRVYHGTAKQLPKHYVARQRLCLSATADYWVNAMDGKPFFVGRASLSIRDCWRSSNATSFPVLNKMCRTNRAPDNSPPILCFTALPWCSTGKVTAPPSSPQ